MVRGSFVGNTETRCEEERDMLTHHDDRPPGALAHGATKPSDIERVRDDIAQAERRIVRGLEAAIARYAQEPNTGAELPDVRIAATTGRCTCPGSGAWTDRPPNRPDVANGSSAQ
jgi:hypothetical protein